MQRIVTFMLAAAAFICSHAIAQNAVTGLWKTIDDQTGKPKSLVRITEQNGEYKGRIEKLFRAADEDQNPKCDKCDGANKGQPILGLTIISGMRQEGNEFTGGQILDPASGKIYKSKMALTDEGKKLNVRGYVGAPMFGRTQTWLREE